jgi:hypothetical protein
MAFSSGVFSRLYNWTSRKNAGSPTNIIDSTTMDAEFDGIATGLSAAILKDGTQTVTANIPMATHKFTGVGVGSALTDSANLGQVQNAAMNYVASDTGSANSYAIAPTPAITSYVAGQVFHFIAANASTGASTLNVSALGTKAIQLGGSALASTEIGTSGITSVIYDGTQFQLMSESQVASAAIGIGLILALG